MMCMSLYCVGLVLVLLNQAGIGDHGFDKKSLDCMWDRMATYPFTVVYAGMLVWIPCIVIGVCYLRLYFFVRTHKKRVSNNLKRNDANSPASELPPKPKLQLAKTFILIYAVFITCWAPYALLIIIDHQDTFLHEVHIYLTVWAHMHPSINWLIYYATQRKMARAYHQILGCTSHQSKQNPRSPRLGGNSSDERPNGQKSFEKGRFSSKRLQVAKDGDSMEWKPIENSSTNNSAQSTNKLSNNNIDIYRKLYDEIRNVHSEGEVQSFVHNNIIKRESLANLRASQSIGDLTKAGIEQKASKKPEIIQSVSATDMSEKINSEVAHSSDDTICDPQSVIISKILNDDSINKCKTCSPQTSEIILRIPCDIAGKEQTYHNEHIEPQSHDFSSSGELNDISSKPNEEDSEADSVVADPCANNDDKK